MRKTKDQLYELIKDLKTKKEFDKIIQQRSKEYDGLLDENIIALLLVDELGRNHQIINKIIDLKPDSECTIYGKVTAISEIRRFTRKNGSVGKVINLNLSDETGTCRLVLWNKNVDLVKDRSIQVGTHLKVINGYIKNDFNGLEVNIGRWSMLEIKPESGSLSVTEEIYPRKNEIRGILVAVEPTRVFFKPTGDVGFVTKIQIRSEDDGIKTLVLWDEKVKEIRSYDLGDLIKINDINVRKENDVIELHVNGRSTINKIQHPS